MPRCWSESVTRVNVHLALMTAHDRGHSLQGQSQHTAIAPTAGLELRLTVLRSVRHHCLSGFSTRVTSEIQALGQWLAILFRALRRDDRHDTDLGSVSCCPYQASL